MKPIVLFTNRFKWKQEKNSALGGIPKNSFKCGGKILQKIILLEDFLERIGSLARKLC